MYDWFKSNGYQPKEVIKKLRQEKVSGEFKILFYSEDSDIEKIINNLKDWESSNSMKRENLKQKKDKSKYKSKIIFYL
ncbi:hypothetical protein H311_02177 [Anncaliia algerae PRA109]|nr:hypothetical protein H311_02177 [Anncaliia algerae PRA109]